MKKIFEQWRQSLKDLEYSRIQDLSDRQKIQVFKEKWEKYQKGEFNVDKAQDIFVYFFGQSIGKGAFRRVWDIGDGKVIKFGDKAENRNEADYYFQQKIKHVIPKIYDASDDYWWIISEMFLPIEQSRISPEILMRNSFPKIYEIYKNIVGSSKLFYSFIPPFIKLKKFEPYLEKLSDKDRIEKFKNSETIKKTINQMAIVVGAAYDRSNRDSELEGGGYKKLGKDKLVKLVNQVRDADISERAQEILKITSITDSDIKDMLRPANIGIDSEGKLILLDISTHNSGDYEDVMEEKMQIDNPLDASAKLANGYLVLRTAEGYDQQAEQLKQISKMVKKINSKKDAAALAENLKRIIKALPKEIQKGKQGKGILGLFTVYAFLKDVAEGNRNI